MSRQDEHNKQRSSIPNGGGRPVTLRRRYTVPSSRTNSTMLKSNPYVGWFRHAPPSRGRKVDRFYYKKHFGASLDSMKNSPHIGWFRHAPPSRLQLSKKKQETLAMLVAQLACTEKWAHDDYCSSSRGLCISGRLPGGTPLGDDDEEGHSTSASFPPLTWLDQKVSDSLHKSLEKHNNEDKQQRHPSSATLNLLSKLASWLLLPLVENDNLPCQLDEETDSEADEDEEIDDKRDDGHVSSSSPLDVSVSSLAEAYYAHQTAKDLVDDHGSYTSMAASYDDGGQQQQQQRLDYVITQMDIARMARNASRHLDVESILSLPTVTYRASPSPPNNKAPQDDDDNDDEDYEGMSWMIISPLPNDDDASQGQNNKNSPSQQQHEDFCVICMEHFVDGDRLRVLPCSHLFHIGCIDRWLSGTHSDFECFTSGCPTCKKRPLAEAEECPPSPDGSVPSWAFSRLGDALAQEESSSSFSSIHSTSA